MINKIKIFIHDIYLKREILFELTKRDFQRQYMGSYLGFIWVYLQPLLFIGVMYMVFTLGLKVTVTHDGQPFIVYLITGMVAWLYIAENLSTMTNVIMQHSFLLKKLDFRLSLLPIVKLTSSFIPHLFLIGVTLLIATTNGIYPTIYILQIIYYYFLLVLLLLGIGWLTSSARIFIPDVSRIVSLLVTFGFWLTPIFWNIDRIPEQYRWLIQLNPITYIVQGYRDSIINHVWFWEHPYQTIYFWLFTLCTLFVGITIFKRLRPHFAEVV